jgi:hypothetical protein
LAYLISSLGTGGRELCRCMAFLLGSARAVFDHGGLKTHRAVVTPLEQDGSIESLLIEAGFKEEQTELQ